MPFPILVHPLPNEAVGDWVKRYKIKTNGRAPTSLDLSAVAVFPCVKFDKRPDEHSAVEVRTHVNALLRGMFDSQHFFVTHDLRVWFSEEVQAITFKLSMDR
jgi:hypothetical protein